MRTIIGIGGWWLAGWWVLDGPLMWRVVWMAVGFAIILCIGGWEENASVRRRAARSLRRNAHKVLGQDISVKLGGG